MGAGTLDCSSVLWLPLYCEHNGHGFWKLFYKNFLQRRDILLKLKRNTYSYKLKDGHWCDICCIFYEPFVALNWQDYFSILYPMQTLSWHRYIKCFIVDDGGRLSCIINIFSQRLRLDDVFRRPFVLRHTIVNYGSDTVQPPWHACKSCLQLTVISCVAVICRFRYICCERQLLHTLSRLW